MFVDIENKFRLILFSHIDTLFENFLLAKVYGAQKFLGLLIELDL